MNKNNNSGWIDRIDTIGAQAEQSLNEYKQRMVRDVTDCIREIHGTSVNNPSSADKSTSNQSLKETRT